MNNKRDLFLSDLHLGSPLFNFNDQICNLLKQTFYERIFLLGDIIDTWENPLYFTQCRHYDIFNLLSELKDRLFFIRGNHDPKIYILRELFKEANIYESYDMRLPDGRRVYMIHGEEFDNLWLEYASIAKALYGIQWILERLNINLKAFYSTLRCSLSSKYRKSYWNELVSAIEMKAVSTYKKDYDALVMGHTHVGKVIHIHDYDKGFTYVNPGSVEKRRATYIEYYDKKFRLRHFN